MALRDGVEINADTTEGHSRGATLEHRQAREEGVASDGQVPGGLDSMDDLVFPPPWRGTATADTNVAERLGANVYASTFAGGNSRASSSSVPRDSRTPLGEEPRGPLHLTRQRFESTGL